MDGAFVIQEHQTDGGRHYDLMLDAGDALVTFQLPVLPADLAVGEAVEARRLADHRRAYLTYEGPISGDRGSVQIVERGSYRAPADGPENWLVDLIGQAAACRVELTRTVGGQFRLVRRPVVDPAG